MITLNGKLFALNDFDFCENRTEDNNICSGYYRVYKKSISILDIDKNKIGVIVNNVLGKATKQSNGKYRYSYGTIKEIGEYSNYIQECNEINKIMKLLN